MTLTLADLRYLLRLVQCDAMDGSSMTRSLRVEGKLAEMIGRMKGGDRVGKTSKAAPKKKAAAKPKGPIGKSVKRK